MLPYGPVANFALEVLSGAGNIVEAARPRGILLGMARLTVLITTETWWIAGNLCDRIAPVIAIGIVLLVGKKLFCRKGHRCNNSHQEQQACDVLWHTLFPYLAIKRKKISRYLW